MFWIWQYKYFIVTTIIQKVEADKIYEDKPSTKNVKEKFYIGVLVSKRMTPVLNHALITTREEKKLVLEV